MTALNAAISVSPTFHLLRNGTPLRSLPLSGDGTLARPSTEPPALSELQYVGFQVEGREPDTEYAVRIGDIPLEVQVIPDDDTDSLPAQAFGRSVIWGDRPYFESTRGVVRAHLSSRALSTA